MRSGLYTGVVYHRRSRPRIHALRYRVFSLLIDLDEIADMTQRLRLLRFNRGGLFSFHEQDHGDGSGTLRSWVEGQIRASGAALPGGRIEVLAYPRVLGYVFNPLSVFFCYRDDGQLAVILYEVSNTYGEKHTYVVPVHDAGPVIRQEAAKAFHVSPFLPPDGRYSFLVEPPGPHVAIGVNLHDDEGILLATSFKGERKPLTDRTLAAAFWKFPLMTLKVIAGIHWEALRLWRKGIAFRPHGKAAAAIGTSVAPGLLLGREEHGVDDVDNAVSGDDIGGNDVGVVHLHPVSGVDRQLVALAGNAVAIRAPVVAATKVRSPIVVLHVQGSDQLHAPLLRGDRGFGSSAVSHDL